MSEQTTETPAKEFDNELRGVLFPNNKRGNAKAPDLTGNVEIEGKKWRVAAWRRTGKKGGQYLSLSLSEFREDPTELAPAPEPEAPSAA